MDRHRLVAHRGDKTHYPENSYAAIKAALQAGTLFVEFDVQMNADNTLVVLHDSNFKRTANLNLSVFDTSTDQMSDISIHEPGRFGEDHYPTPVSTLTEIMTLTQKYPAVTVFVEIKKESLEHFGVQMVMDELINELQAHASQAVIISFSFEAIEYAQKQSSLKTGWVLGKYDEPHHQRALLLKPDYLFCNYKKIADDKLWKGDWKWAAYTINELNLARQMLTRNIDLVETNDICLLLGVE